MKKTYCVFYTDYSDRGQHKFVDAESVEDAKLQVRKLNECQEIVEVYEKVWEA